jgi:class 3 adenylate cyclase
LPWWLDHLEQEKLMTSSSLPQGTLTLLFSDMVGSTKLLARLGKQYIPLLLTQREILREATDKWDGYEVETSGDAFFGVFPRAISALHAAIDIQKQILKNPWPDNVDVELSIGLHTGEPWLVEDGYVGLDLNRTYRICELARGGQVLLSETTAYLVHDELPQGASLVERGIFKLLDIDRTVRVFELIIEGLGSNYPDLRAIPAELPFAGLPTGTVTFLFTDIEGSTTLLKRLHKDYAWLLDKQRQIIREAFVEQNGREVDASGEEFFFAFPRASDAIEAAIYAQRRLFEYAWPDGAEVRVRMGLHTGEPWVRADGYIGIDVVRASRIMNVGHGGQVLLSETTTALVKEDLPEGVALLDLGRHTLKDITSPERISQLVIKDLPSVFPPLKSF